MIYLSYLCTRNSAKGSLAQLVQSVCLTSRGSGVRIPQLPQRNGPLTGMRVARFCKERRYGGIAQLVQSACLTGRRSAVQIRMLLQVGNERFAVMQTARFGFCTEGWSEAGADRRLPAAAGVRSGRITRLSECCRERTPRGAARSSGSRRSGRS